MVIRLGEPSWIKICEISTRPIGAVIDVELTSLFEYKYNIAKKLFITYGWADVSLFEITKSVDYLFDKIRIFYGNSNTSKVEVLIHYNASVYNTIYMKCDGVGIKRMLNVVDITNYGYAYKEYNLGLSGVYYNGENIN